MCLLNLNIRKIKMGNTEVASFYGEAEKYRGRIEELKVVFGSKKIGDDTIAELLAEQSFNLYELGELLTPIRVLEGKANFKKDKIYSKLFVLYKQDKDVNGKPSTEKLVEARVRESFEYDNAYGDWLAVRGVTMELYALKEAFASRESSIKGYIEMRKIGYFSGGAGSGGAGVDVDLSGSGDAFNTDGGL